MAKAKQKPAPHVFTIGAIKGGVAKTTTCGALAQAAAAAGKRTLCIDLDPQCNLSLWMGADFTKPNSCDVITGHPARDAVQEIGDNLSIICGSANLAQLKTGPGSAWRLFQALSGGTANDYEYIFIDTAPAMGELQNIALFASGRLIVPLEAETNSLQALYQIVDIAQHVDQTKHLQIVGAVVTKFDPRPKINRFMRDTIKDQAQAAGVPYLGEIRQGIAVREAQAMRQDLYSYAPNSKPAQDYLELFKKVAQED
ncbi:MAG: ParA family protein [Clostridia bacterium]|nr:ParA family protein [Clostridia bacterium]